ncbi:MAG: hypothetical protein M3Q29_09750 [Chloroflexota bacterium]|nr:hypothetical protein [Chloroflexota bacterium]
MKRFIALVAILAASLFSTASASAEVEWGKHSYGNTVGVSRDSGAAGAVITDSWGQAVIIETTGR